MRIVNYTHTHTVPEKTSDAHADSSPALAMYDSVNGPNLDKDSSQIEP